MQTGEPSQIRAIIVDDERLAVKGIELLLTDHPSVRVVASANSLDRAVRLIQELRPDVVFLDIQLQGENGFELFDKVDVDARVIFITAYDEYAVKAFEVNALDYLLKPVSRHRFNETIQRLFDKQQRASERRSGIGYEDSVVMNVGRAMRFVRLNTIVCIHAEGDYSNVAIDGEKEALAYRSMKAWEKILPPDDFIRVHRSAIVNIHFIDRVEPTTSNRLVLNMLNHHSPITMSQRCAAYFKKVWTQPSQSPSKGLATVE